MESEPRAWRTEPRRVYSSEFKLRLVELATRPDANVADIARTHGVNDNVLFKWIRLWRKEGRVFRRLPAPVPSVSPPAAFPVEIVPDSTTRQSPALSGQGTGSTCSLTLRHGTLTLDNPDPEIQLRIVRELAGRSTV